MGEERTVEDRQSTYGKSEAPEPVGADADALLAGLLAASDLSSGSDEIFLLMTSPWRRMVLSSRRTVLLADLDLDAGATVLEVGPGGGAVTRWLLEQGHRVVAVCGSAVERELVAARCAGLDRLDLRDGGFDAVGPEESFDALVHLPVSVAAAPRVAPDALVELAGRVLRPGAPFVWSFANPVGVDAIAGLADAAGGLSLHGLDVPAVRWSDRAVRSEIDRALRAGGFDGLAWSGCFPDDRTPSATVAADLLEDPAAAGLVDQLVGASLRSAPGSLLLVDARRVLTRLCEGGAGGAVAPGWVVRCRRAGAPVEDAPDGPSERVLARLAGAERLRPWQHELRVVAGGDGVLAVERTRRWPEAGLPEQGWLRNEAPARVPFVSGPTLERSVIDAVASGDVAELRRLLSQWYDWLEARCLDDVPDVVANPFCPPGSDRVLPPELLDAVVSNFVVTEGGLAFIDDEWRAEGGVAFRTVVVRALCRLAYGLVAGGSPLPWPATASGDLIAQTLGHLVGFAFDETDIARWRVAEAELQAIVYGGDVTRSVDALVAEGATSRVTLGVARRVPFSRMAGEVVRLQAELDRLRAAYDEAVEAHERMDADRDALRVRAEALGRELSDARYDLEAHERLAAALRGDIEQIHQLRRANDDLVRRVRTLENRLPLRLYRKAKQLAVGPEGGPRHRALAALRRRLAG